MTSNFTMYFGGVFSGDHMCTVQSIVNNLPTATRRGALSWYIEGLQYARLYVRLLTSQLIRPCFTVVISNLSVDCDHMNKGYATGLIVSLKHLCGSMGWNLEVENVLDDHLESHLLKNGFYRYNPGEHDKCYRYGGVTHD